MMIPEQVRWSVGDIELFPLKVLIEQIQFTHKAITGAVLKERVVG